MNFSLRQCLIEVENLTPNNRGQLYSFDHFLRPDSVSISPAKLNIDDDLMKNEVVQKVVEKIVINFIAKRQLLNRQMWCTILKSMIESTSSDSCHDRNIKLSLVSAASKLDSKIMASLFQCALCAVVSSVVDRSEWLL